MNRIILTLNVFLHYERRLLLIYCFKYAKSYGVFCTVYYTNFDMHISTYILRSLLRFGFEPNIFDTNLINNFRVFIKYCVFFRIYTNIPDSGLSLFSLIVSLCTQTSQVENQRWCRTDRVQKNHNIWRKKHNI